jgi:POT family proton-dependent oligopeptide transporter
MLAGLAQFLWGQRYLRGHAEPPRADALRERVWGLPREAAIYAGSILCLAPIAGLMWAVGNNRLALGGHVSLALALMIVVMLVVLGWFVWFVTKHCTPVERHRMIVLLTLIFMCLVFFTLYEQTYGSWVTFTDRMLTKDMVPALVQPQPEVVWTSSLGANLALFARTTPWSILSLLLAPLAFVVSARISDRHPASRIPAVLFGGASLAMLVFLVRDVLVLPQTAGSLTFLGAFFIVVLAPIFTALWGWLDRFGADPSKPIKSAIGLAFGGLAFVPLALAAGRVGETEQLASVWWLVLAYFVLELGEMCLSPVGLSAVTQLSVARVVSLMMGTWFLATAFSETLAAMFGKLAAIDETSTVVDAAGKYEHLFWVMMWIGLGFALLAFLAAPVLRRGMHGIK